MLLCTSVSFLVVVSFIGSQQAVAAQKNPIPAYEIYSWQNDHGEWIFSLMAHTSREKTVKEVFSPKFTVGGVEALKARISTLPDGTTVFMMAGLRSASKQRVKGDERLKLPRSGLIDTIRQHAEKHSIKLEVPGVGAP